LLIDTHAHLNAEEFAEDREAVIRRAQENGVTTIVNIGFDRETIPTCLELAERYDFIYAVIGWHPQHAKEMTDADLEWIAGLTKHPKVVGLGEMGLDYYWDTSPRDVQAEVFRKQIRLARQLGLPIVIHNRDAHQDVVNIIRLGLERAAEGIYNLAGDGALSLREIAEILGKPYRPLPPGLIRGVLGLLKPLGLTQYGPEQLDFLRYRPVLANRRLKEEFGYQPRYSSREAFLAFLAAQGIEARG